MHSEIWPWNDNIVYSSKRFDNYPFCKVNILFLHALTGCDRTSCFYNKGEKSLFQHFEKNNNERLRVAICYFYRENADKNLIFENGVKCILHVYKAPKKVQSLNELRYILFRKSVVKKAVNLATLPPTSDAARQHFFRVYCQIQQWLSSKISPESWGWQKQDILMPTKMTQDAAPLEILNMIFCNCKTGCKKACGCRKAGISCSSACGHCQTGNCTNLEKNNVDIDEDEDNDDFDDQTTINGGNQDTQGSDFEDNFSEDENDIELYLSSEEEWYWLISIWLMNKNSKI